MFAFPFHVGDNVGDLILFLLCCTNKKRMWGRQCKNGAMWKWLLPSKGMANGPTLLYKEFTYLKEIKAIGE